MRTVHELTYSVYNRLIQWRSHERVPCCAYVYANVVALKTDNKTCLHVCYDDNCRKLSVGIYDIWGIGIGMMDRIRVDQIFDGSRCG